MSSTATLSAPLGNQREQSPGWWAMVWTIATEASLFAYLLFAYFYLATQARGPWPVGGPLGLTLSAPNTAILVISSFVFMWAERGLRVNDRARLRLGLGITFLLGFVFAVIQGIEWSKVPFRPHDGVFPSLFFTITGFHFAHVIVGLLMLLVAQAGAWKNAYTAERRLGVTVVGMYWHFVDIVWLVVFTTLYLSPRWS